MLNQVDQGLTFAYVLHMRAYRESSAIVELIHGEGRTSCVVKGVLGKRKSAQLLRSTLQPFQPIKCHYFGKGELKSLTQVESAGVNPQLMGEQLFSGLYINELLSKTYQVSAECQAVFELYQQTLSQLATLSTEKSALDDSPSKQQQSEALQLVLRRFEFTLLSLLGYGLDFTYDPSTGKKITTDKSYCYQQELGFIIDQTYVEQEQQRGLHLSGKQIQAIKLSLDGHQWCSPEVVQHAKRLARAALAPVLGGKTIESKGLFQ